jgi:NTE family protein
VIDGLNWRWVFLVNVPIGVALVAATLPESRDERHRRPLDIAGMALFGTASLLLVVGLIRGNDDGWDSGPILAALIGSASLFVAFGLVERRAPAR